MRRPCEAAELLISAAALRRVRRHGPACRAVPVPYRAVPYRAVLLPYRQEHQPRDTARQADYDGEGETGEPTVESGVRRLWKLQRAGRVWQGRYGSG